MQRDTGWAKRSKIYHQQKEKDDFQEFPWENEFVEREPLDCSTNRQETIKLILSRNRLSFNKVQEIELKISLYIQSLKTVKQ